MAKDEKPDLESATSENLQIRSSWLKTEAQTKKPQSGLKKDA